MPIITTRCSPIAQAIDTLLTAIAWCGFLYLFIQEISTLFIATPENPSGGSAAQLSLTAQTLLIYLTVAAFNALLLVLWARYHKLFFKNMGHRDALELDEETLASSFSLSCHQLRQMQESRIAVIHHTIDGNINSLETQSQRLQPASNSAVFDALHLA